MHFREGEMCIKHTKLLTSAVRKSLIELTVLQAAPNRITPLNKYAQTFAQLFVRCPCAHKEAWAEIRVNETEIIWIASPSSSA
jgi:hypothetical protein